MDYGGSPWGDDSNDSAPADLPPSPRLPSFGTATAPVSSWGDDAGGGWGTAVDDFPSYDAHPSRIDVDITTEDLEVGVSSSSGGGGGWGAAEELPFPSPTPADSQVPLPRSAGSPSTSRTSPPLPPLSPTSRGFAPSPPLPSFSPPPIDIAPLSLSDPSFSSTPAASSSLPSDSATAPSLKKDDDWGDYGTSPKLPPIELKAEMARRASRDTGWGGEDEWQPAEVPLPLPTFGTSFGGRHEESESSGDTDEGWGGASAVPSWSLGGTEEETEVEHDGEDAWEPKDVTLRPRSGKSIPAALVNNLKTSSREFADATWTVPKDAWGKDGFQEQAGGVLLEPPLLPPSSSNGPITNETPLPSLFRLTPTLYPAFNEGIAKTALRATETLKGTSSSAYRNARFGNLVRNAKVDESTAKSGEDGGLWDGASSLATPVLSSERGRAGDEFDLDRPGQATNKRRSWWGASGGQNATTTNMPSSLLGKKEDDRTAGIPDYAQENAVASSSSIGRPPASPTLHPEPGTLGRLWGRLKRPTTVTPEEPEHDEWKGRDLDYLNRGVPVSKIAQAKQDLARMDDSLGSFFGDAPPQPSRRAPLAAQDKFQGLAGSLNASPRKVAAKAKSLNVLVPFDPFADDEDDYGIASPVSATSPITPAPPSVARVLSPPIRPSSRAISSSLQTSPPIGSDVLSFPPIAAPQARGVSSITTAAADDSFDSFFSSFAPTPTPTTPNPSNPPPPLSRAALSSSYRAPVVPTKRSDVSPPLRTATNPPPPRVAPVSPPAAIFPPPATYPIQPTSASSTAFFAPPPAPTQPLRGFSGISPPPSAPKGSPAGVRPPVAAPPAATRTPALGTKADGPLSMDDLSFFES